MGWFIAIFATVGNICTTKCLHIHAHMHTRCMYPFLFHNGIQYQYTLCTHTRGEHRHVPAMSLLMSFTVIFVALFHGIVLCILKHNLCILVASCVCDIHTGNTWYPLLKRIGERERGGGEGGRLNILLISVILTCCLCYFIPLSLLQSPPYTLPFIIQLLSGLHNNMDTIHIYI